MHECDRRKILNTDKSIGRYQGQFGLLITVRCTFRSPNLKPTDDSCKALEELSGTHLKAKDVLIDHNMNSSECSGDPGDKDGCLPDDSLKSGRSTLETTEYLNTTACLDEAFGGRVSLRTMLCALADGRGEA